MNFTLSLTEYHLKLALLSLVPIGIFLLGILHKKLVKNFKEDYEAVWCFYFAVSLILTTVFVTTLLFTIAINPKPPLHWHEVAIALPFSISTTYAIFRVIGFLK